MKVMNTAKAILGALILMVFLQPILAMEETEVTDETKGQGMSQKEMPVLDSQIEAHVRSLIEKNQSDTKKLIDALKESFGAALQSQDEKHKEALAGLKAEHKQALKDQIEVISHVIKQDPPSFKQRLTSSKYIWTIGAVTLGGIAISFGHFYDGLYSMPYATVRAVVDNLPLLINSYYVAKIIQESATIKGSLASHTAKTE